MSPAKPWRELEREHLLDGRVFSVERSLAESPQDGSRHTFFRIRSCDWAQVVPVTAAGDVVMVRQYRHGVGRITLEVPGGLVDAGEDPAATAARECLEETGYRAPAVIPLGTLAPNPALFSNRLHTFLAQGVERVGEAQNTGTEHTEVVLVPNTDLPRLLRSGEIDHALIVATLWRYVHEYPAG